MKGKCACTKCSFYIDISCHKGKSVTIKEPDCDKTVVYNPGFSLVFADFRKQQPRPQGFRIYQVINR